MTSDFHGNITTGRRCSVRRLPIKSKLSFLATVTDVHFKFLATKRFSRLTIMNSNQRVTTSSSSNDAIMLGPNATIFSFFNKFRSTSSSNRFIIAHYELGSLFPNSHARPTDFSLSLSASSRLFPKEKMK